MGVPSGNVGAPTLGGTGFGRCAVQLGPDAASAENAQVSGPAYRMLRQQLRISTAPLSDAAKSVTSV